MNVVPDRKSVARELVTVQISSYSAAYLKADRERKNKRKQSRADGTDINIPKRTESSAQNQKAAGFHGDIITQC